MKLSPKYGGTLLTFVLMAAAVLSTGQSSCIPTLDPPLFDATGMYTGMWEGTAMEGGETLTCGLSFALEKDTRPGISAQNRFAGTATIDISCVTLPNNVTQPNDGVTDVTVFVVGDSMAVASLPRCGAGLCAELFMDATGMDTDDDGFLNTFSGDWEYSILQDREPIYTVSGSFEANESL